MQALARLWPAWLLVLSLVSSGARAQAPDSNTAVQQCRNNLQVILRGLTQYSRDHKQQYPDSLEQLVPRYLSQLPQCPADPNASYARYSSLISTPPRVALICSNPNHTCEPPDYLVLSSDRGEETPFSSKADPAICRRTLVQFAQQLLETRSAGLYPETVSDPPRCSCGDPIQYFRLEGGKNFQAFCPGAAHLGSGLAPFSPSIDRGGLHEENLLLTSPEIPAPASTGRRWPWVLAALIALVTLVTLLIQVWLRRRPIRLD